MLKVHRDDPCEVYITVRMPDGREKQTTVGYLQRVLPTQVPHDAGSSNSGVEVDPHARLMSASKSYTAIWDSKGSRWRISNATQTKQIGSRTCREKAVADLVALDSGTHKSQLKDKELTTTSQRLGCYETVPVRQSSRVTGAPPPQRIEMIDNKREITTLEGLCMHNVNSEVKRRERPKAHK